MVGGSVIVVRDNILSTIVYVTGGNDCFTVHDAHV